MKVIFEIFCLAALTGHVYAAEVLAQKNAVLVLSPDMETAESHVAVEKLKADLAAQGMSITEIPADEAQDIGQAGLIADGGPVIAAENREGKLEFKVYDGSSGADITTKFNVVAVNNEKRQPVAALSPEPAKKEKTTPKPSSVNKRTALKKNHFGLSIGYVNLGVFRVCCA